MTISLAVLWFDDDTIELSVRCASATFAGQAACYVLPSALVDLASALEHFPRSPLDRRVVELGTFSPELAGGGVRLQLGCDGAGHVRIDVHVRGPRGPEPSADEPSARFALATEAAAIDAFVRALRAARVEVGETVTLATTDGG